MNGGLTSVDNGARRRGAARRRQGQFRLPCRRLRPARATTTASRAIPICSAATRRRRSTAGSRTRRCAPNGQSVGGSYVFDGGFVGAAISQFNSLYRIPGIEAAETDTRIDMQPDQGHQQRRIPAASLGDRGHPLLARRHRLPARRARQRERLRRHAADLHQQGAGRPRRGAAHAVRSALRRADHGSRRAGHASAPDRPGRRGGLFDPNRPTSVAGFMFNEFQFNETFRMQIAGRIEQVNVTGSVPDSSRRSVGQHRPRPHVHAEERRHRLPAGPALGSGRQPDRAICRARAARAGAPFARRARGDRDLRHRQSRICGSRPPSPSRSACAAPRGPFRFEATAYYTSFAGFIFRASPARPAKARSILAR